MQELAPTQNQALQYPFYIFIFLLIIVVMLQM